MGKHYDFVIKLKSFNIIMYFMKFNSGRKRKIFIGCYYGRMEKILQVTINGCYKINKNIRYDDK